MNINIRMGSFGHVTAKLKQLKKRVLDSTNMGEDIAHAALVYLEGITPYRGTPSSEKHEREDGSDTPLKDSYYLESGGTMQTSYPGYFGMVTDVFWHIKTDQPKLFDMIDLGTRAHGPVTANNLIFPDTRDGDSGETFIMKKVAGIKPHALRDKVAIYVRSLKPVYRSM